MVDVPLLRRLRRRGAGAASGPSRNRPAPDVDAGIMKKCVMFLLRNGWTIGIWTVSSLAGFGITAFNSSLTRARFNREMEIVKKSIETNMNKHFSVIVASKGESAQWLNRYAPNMSIVQHRRGNQQCIKIDVPNLLCVC